MSSYTKTTDFASKDGLLTGNPLKIVSGTELNDEFNALQVAVNTKANSNSPTLTGVPLVPTATAGTSTTQAASTGFVTAATDILAATFETLYPVGSIYTNASVSTNPATLLGFGTWVAFGSGKVLVGLDAGDTSFDTLGETGGSKDAVNVSHTHTATVADSGHTHSYSNRTSPAGRELGLGFSDGFDYRIAGTSTSSSSTTGVTVSNSTEGVSGTDANLQPYVTVYQWKRTV